MLSEEYIDARIDPEPPHLRRLYRRTNLTRLYPRMCSGHAQGRLLVMLTRMIRPARILELGTFTGYSALCFAEGSDDTGALIDTVELDDEYADELRALFDESPGGDRITLHIADAEAFLASATGQYDLIFIDANKRRYTAYYEAALRILRPGGYILADNTLWSDKVGRDEARKDPQTAGIEAFNDLVAADTRVETVILPLRDGLTIIRKRPA